VLNFQIPEIRIAEKKLKEDLIGHIYFDNKNGLFEVINLLKNENTQIFDLGVQPCDLLLINDQLISANYPDKCITVNDKDLKLLKKINKIKGENFNPLAIQVNSKERFIYICDNPNHKILMADFDFNLNKSFGSEGAENNQLRHPCDICFHNDFLYICDNGNKRVQVYSKDLNFVKSIKLDYNPWKIKAINFTICVEAYALGGTHFYNLNDFSLIRSYYHGMGRISQINSCFYEFNHKTKRIYCYDENGELIEEVTLKSLDDVLTSKHDGAFIDYNREILMMSCNQKKIIKFF
jgi:hypothetical protein